MATGGGVTFGVVIRDSGLISSTGAATIDITVLSRKGLAVVLDAGITSVDGAITITATGNGTGADNYGIYLSFAGAISSTGAATIDITAVGGNGTSSNYGLYVSETDSAITSLNGNITISATGGAGSSFNNYGIYLASAGAISSTGSATIDIIAVGGNGTNTNYGLYINGLNSEITSLNGGITITATGNGSGTNNYGLYIYNAGSISSTGTANIDLTGTGKTSDGYGVYLNSGDITSTSSGNINILANALDASTTDFVFSATSDIGSGAASGNITITADTLSFLGTVQTTGNVILQPSNVTTGIGLGDGVSGTFNLDDTEILALTANTYNSTTIGRSDGGHRIIIGTGDATIYDFSNNALILGGDVIEVNNQINSGAQNVTFNIGQVSSGTLDLKALINTTGTFAINGDVNNDIFYMRLITQTAIIDGGIGRNSIYAGNNNNVWTFTAANSGTLGTITFSNITDVKGGSLNDTFIMQTGGSMTGIVDGGSLSWNILDYTLYGAPAYYSIKRGTATGLGGIRNINEVIGAEYSEKISKEIYKLFNGLNLRCFNIFIWSPLIYFYEKEFFFNFNFLNI